MSELARALIVHAAQGCVWWLAEAQKRQQRGQGGAGIARRYAARWARHAFEIAARG